MADDSHARAFWVASPGHGEIRDEAIAAPTAASAIVRARYSGISRGTESLVFQGRVPASEYQRMRAPFQAGDFPAPVKYGYASVGQVESGPAALEGRDVFVLHPHQTRYNVPVEAVHVLPPDVPPARAVLAANLETAINGVWDARPHVGDRVAVVGAGSVGCLVAWVAKRAGCDVVLVDVNPARRAIATNLGVGFALPAGAAPDADLVIHASGSATGLDLACRLAAFESTVVEMSWYGTQVVALSLGEAFHARRLVLKSSQVGHVASTQRARWDHRRRMQLALSMLADPALDALITGESEFADLPAVMARLSTAPGDTLCHRIRY
jgi:NADPH:quinone reductase-like Zn-dependent oxidoreductase